MEIANVLEEKENELIGRKELKFIVVSDKTPSYEEAKKFIAEKFRANEELVVIKLIKGKFGLSKFLIEAFVYKDKESMELYEGKKEGEKKEEEGKEEKGGEAKVAEEKQENKEEKEEKPTATSPPPKEKETTGEEGEKKQAKEEKQEQT